MRWLICVRLLPCLLVVTLGSPALTWAASIDVSGAPGIAGTAGAAGNPGQVGGPGGDGEPATASSTSPDTLNFATATGGTGGDGGDGGDGVPAGASAGSGSAGGTGGAAAATSSASTASATDDTAAISVATGGAGGAGGAGGSASGAGTAGLAGAGGAGGAASSQANAPGDPEAVAVSADAEATGGTGGASQGAGGVGGSATASAYARSDSGDAGASVFQRGGDGGAGAVTAGRGQDSVLVNAASGDAAGSLALDQTAMGGAGGEGPGSHGGDARAELSTERSSGTGLFVSAAAYGGAASSSDGSTAGAARGGNAAAMADAVDHVGAPVQVSGSAAGGDAFGPNSQVGQASLSVHGASTAGGDVAAQGYMSGGSGSVGGSVDLVDVVSGETTGSLSLVQSAGGGSGIELVGSASSRLHRTGSFRALDATASALAGSAFDTETPSHADGGNAYAESEAGNDAGNANARVEAYAGDGASGPGSDGGNGESLAAATTSGDGHASAADSYARGGSTHVEGALPGGAHSVSSATALGNSTATATSTASGGVGFFGSSLGSVLSGGNALAEATASGAGSAAVLAHASAIGGFGLFGESTPLGPAHANAFASGLGLVGSTATAFGDATSSAQSEAHSAGSVLASRASLTPLGPQQNPYVLIGADASFRAPSTQARADALTSQGYDTYALLNAAPSTSDAVSWVVSSPIVWDTVVHASEIHALGRLAARDGVLGSLSLDFDGAALPADDLVIAFVNPHAPSFSGFDVLDLQVSFAGTVVWDQSFDTPGEVEAALDGTFVTIDSASIPSAVTTLVIRWLFDDGTNHSSFSSDFVVFSGSSTPVPEPGAMALVLVVLAALVSQLVRAPRTDSY